VTVWYHVRDLDEGRRFYQELLGFEEVALDLEERWSELRRGEMEIGLAEGELVDNGVAHVEVTDLKADRVAVVEFNGMPELPPGKVYELWLITSRGHANAAGVFVPDSSGHTVVVVDRSLEGYSVMAVTVEAGPSGVSSPSQQPAMTGNIA